jgi:hypothetical protein
VLSAKFHLGIYISNGSEISEVASFFPFGRIVLVV